MEEKVAELKKKIETVEREQERTGDTLYHIKQTLEKLATNQEKLIQIEQEQLNFRHELETIKKEIAHKEDLSNGKIKGHKELTEKDISDLKKDVEEFKRDFKDFLKGNRTRDWGIIIALASAFGGLILTILGVK